MLTFLKTQVSSLLATLLDFLTTIFFVEVLHAHYVAATIAGAVTGAFANFFINKHWSFASGRNALKRQGFRYFLVWMGSVILNTLGIYLMTEGAGLSYITSKLLVAILVGVAFNYTLQKHYVFVPHEKILSK